MTKMTIVTAFLMAVAAAACTDEAPSWSAWPRDSAYRTQGSKDFNRNAIDAITSWRTAIGLDCEFPFSFDLSGREGRLIQPTEDADEANDVGSSESDSGIVVLEGAPDRQMSIAHGLGHALGLGHVETPGALMSESGGKFKAEDVDAARAILDCTPIRR